MTVKTFPQKYAIPLLVMSILDLTSSLAFADQDATDATKQAAASIDHALEVVTQSNWLHPRPICSMEKRKCSFAEFCQSFLPNENAANIYQNAEGQVLPNPSYIYAEIALNNCRSNLPKPAALALVPPEQIVAYQKALQERSNKAQKAFLKHLADHGEAKAFLRLQTAALDQPLPQQVGGLYGNPQGPGQQSDLRKSVLASLEKLESQAGVRLSKQSTELYLDWLAPAPLSVPVSLLQAKPNTAPPDIEQNPFLNVNLLTDQAAAGSASQLSKNQDHFLAEMDRVKSVFKETKSRIIEFLNSKRDSSNQLQIDGLVKRIDTISIKMFSPLNSSFIANSLCAYPNMYYAPRDHSFTVCPNTLQNPSATLMEVMAHELGHSIDPCDLQNPLFAIQGSPNPNTPKNNPFNKGAQPGLELFFNTPSSGKNGETRYSEVQEEDLKIFGPQAFIDLKTSKLSEAVPFKQNPFKSAISCLQSYGSVRAAVADKSSAKAVIDEKIQHLRDSGVDDRDPIIQGLKDSKRNYKVNGDDLRFCSSSASPHGPAQMQEAFSDWLAQKVVDKKIQDLKHTKSPQEVRQFTFESSAFFSIDCANLDPRFTATVGNALANEPLCDRRSSAYQKEMRDITPVTDSHPDTSVRMNRNFYASPTVQKALGCQPNGEVVNCD